MLEDVPLPVASEMPTFPGEEPYALPTEEGYLEEVAAAQPSNPDAQSVPNILMRQSQALNALVLQLANQDGLGDLGGSSASNSGISLKGSAKREKMISLMAARKSQFFLQVAQNAHRRLRPSEVVPQSLADFNGKPLFAKYLERHGGFAGSKDLGFVMWLLGRIGDQFIQGDVKSAQEMTALALVAVEQASMDGGKWDLAWTLALEEEPPHGLFAGRPQGTNPRMRAFSPLCPGDWAATSLGFIKEIDILNSRRAEAVPGAKKPPPGPDQADPKPKKQPKHPKKPKQENESK